MVARRATHMIHMAVASFLLTLVAGGFLAAALTNVLT